CAPGSGGSLGALARPTPGGWRLGRGALAGAHGALHVAVPPGRRLAAGPVHATDRGAQRRSHPSPLAGAEHRAVAAAGPGVGRPVLVAVGGPVADRGPEPGAEAAEHLLAPGGR